MLLLLWRYVVVVVSVRTLAATVTAVSRPHSALHTAAVDVSSVSWASIIHSFISSLSLYTRWRKRQCQEQCQVHAGKEDHARPGWTTSRRGQDSPWKSQSEWLRTEINGENKCTSMVCGQPSAPGRLKNRTYTHRAAGRRLHESDKWTKHTSMSVNWRGIVSKH